MSRSYLRCAAARVTRQIFFLAVFYQTACELRGRVVHIGGEFSGESNSQQQKHKTCLRTLVCDGRLGAVVAAIWNRLQDSPRN